jgi:hypothetical protein
MAPDEYQSGFVTGSNVEVQFIGLQLVAIITIHVNVPKGAF